MLAPKTVYSVVTPLFYSSKLFGLAPFKIKKGGFTKSRLNQIICIIFAIIVYLYTIIFFDDKPQLSNFTQLPIILHWYFNPLNMFCNIVFESVFSEKLLKVFIDIGTFDNDIHKYLQINLEKKYQKEMIYICIWLMVIILLLILSSLLTGMIYLKISCHYFLEIFFVHNAPLIVNTFVILQICTLILFIKQRLVWLNEKLSSLTSMNEKRLLYSTQNHVSQSKFLYIFEKIRLKHLKLNKISNNINEIYSLQILLIIFKNFITLIGEFLYYGKNFINNKHIDTRNMILSQIQLIIAISQIVALVFACSQVSIQAEKTASLIHNINAQDYCDDNLKMQVNFFSLQLMQENLQFTACRIFIVNENLLLTIAGAVSTYLVIVIQFQFGSTKQPITNT